MSEQAEAPGRLSDTAGIVNTYRMDVDEIMPARGGEEENESTRTNRLSNAEQEDIINGVVFTEEANDGNSDVEAQDESDYGRENDESIENEIYDDDTDDDTDDDYGDETVPQSADESMSLKRKYKFVNRKKRSSPKKDRRANWLSTLDTMTEPKLRRMSCCKKLSCFKNVHYEYFLQKSRQLLSSSNTVRRTLLSSMVGADSTLMFNGKLVCVRFMKKAFRFSTECLARDRKPYDETDCNSAQRSANNLTSTASTTSSRTIGFHKISPQKDAILSFLLRLGEDCSERMPDTNELHLPFFQKREVYALFVNEYKKLYPGSVPSDHYFFSVWKKNCSQIKVRKASRFTICEVCEEIRSSMKDAIIKGEKMDRILEKRAVHLKMVHDERMEYQKKRDRARLNPSEYCSIIIDGADQREYGLPHFAIKTKDQKGLSLKLKLIGLLEHEVQNVLHIFTMTEEHETGANHIIECLHRFINSRKRKGSLPRKFFVQMDNCSRENKNRYVFSYLEALVALDIFDVVEAGFLPKGHTHEDVDQCFSQLSGRLKTRDAITVLDMHRELSHVNKGHTEVCHLKRLVNWSGLCENERCVNGITNFTQYRYFKFSRTFQESLEGNDSKSTTCHVRLNCYDSWKPLMKSKKGRGSGFLKFCPDLKKIPPLKIKCPDGEKKVIDRLVSEEGRVNDTDKMSELHELRQFVFRNRVDEFHWDLSTAVEVSRCTYYGSNTQHVDDDYDMENIADSVNNEEDQIMPVLSSNTNTNRPNMSSFAQPPLALTNLEASVNMNEPRDSIKALKTSDKPASRFTYDAGSFVAVQPDDGTQGSSAQFWIGKVVSVIKGKGETLVRELKVHWYSPSKEDEPLQSDYHPLYEAKTKKIKQGNSRKIARRDLKTPWIDQIDTDCILISFNSLTKKHCLPLSVKKKLGL